MGHAAAASGPDLVWPACRVVKCRVLVPFRLDYHLGAFAGDYPKDMA